MLQITGLLLKNKKLNRMKLHFLNILLAGMFLFLVQSNVQAQNVRVSEEPKITEMMEQFETINKSRTTFPGWRIQILTTTDRNKVESAKYTFQYRYPNIPVYWVHSSPNFNLRAGAFSSKLDALRLKHILEQDYPRTYLVWDEEIRPEELLDAY